MHCSFAPLFSLNQKDPSLNIFPLFPGTPECTANNVGDYLDVLSTVLRLLGDKAPEKDSSSVPLFTLVPQNLEQTGSNTILSCFDVQYKGTLLHHGLSANIPQAIDDTKFSFYNDVEKLWTVILTLTNLVFHDLKECKNQVTPHKGDYSDTRAISNLLQKYLRTYNIAVHDIVLDPNSAPLKTSDDYSYTSLKERINANDGLFSLVQFTPLSPERTRD